MEMVCRNDMQLKLAETRSKTASPVSLSAFQPQSAFNSPRSPAEGNHPETWSLIPLNTVQIAKNILQSNLRQQLRSVIELIVITESLLEVCVFNLSRYVVEGLLKVQRAPIALH